MSESTTKKQIQANRQWPLLAALVCATVLVAALLFSSHQTANGAELKPNAKRAYDYLLQVCKIGPRVSGTPGMAAQQKLIQDHFVKFGAQVKYQAFDHPHPNTGRPIRLANMVISWNPQATERVLLGCHYDTRPFPDRDRFNPRGRFIGANDGASGVALFMEMAHHMKDLKPRYGVDMVIFDAEELVYNDERDKYFIGSEHFSKDYVNNPTRHRYICGLVLDMIGDRNLEIFQERNSLTKYAPQVTKSLWATAARLRVREFIATPKHAVNDDHVPLNEIAGIPTANVIDFDYPYWHTQQDIPLNCSGESLAKVALVTLVWLEEMPRMPVPLRPRRQ